MLFFYHSFPAWFVLSIIGQPLRRSKDDAPEIPMQDGISCKNPTKTKKSRGRKRHQKSSLEHNWEIFDEHGDPVSDSLNEAEWEAKRESWRVAYEGTIPIRQSYGENEGAMVRQFMPEINVDEFIWN